jgi:hypothetical protein
LLPSQNCTKGFGINKNKQTYNELSVNMSLTSVKPLQILYENPQRQPQEISHGTRLGVALGLDIHVPQYFSSLIYFSKVHLCHYIHL